MYQTEYKRYPIESKTERAVGIALPLNKPTYGRKFNQSYNSANITGTGVFVKTYSTEEQAVYNLVNLILTRRGERPMQPEFGSPVPEYVFEQNTDESRFVLQEDLRETINFWMPYLVLGDLQVLAGNGRTPGDAMNAVSIIIPFRVTENGANITITFTNLSGRFEFDINNN